MIEVTTREGATKTIDDGDIYYVKPALNECTLYFIDGTALPIRETFEEVRRRIQANNKR